MKNTVVKDSIRRSLRKRLLSLMSEISKTRLIDLR